MPNVKFIQIEHVFWIVAQNLASELYVKKDEGLTETQIIVDGMTLTARWSGDDIVVEA